MRGLRALIGAKDFVNEREGESFDSMGEAYPTVGVRMNYELRITNDGKIRLWSEGGQESPETTHV